MKFSFRNQKKEKNIKDLIKEIWIYQKLIEDLSKSKSMLKLSRIKESQEILDDAERLVNNYINQNPLEAKAYMMLILLYLESNNQDRAEPIIKHLLNSGQFKLNDEEHLILSGELQKILRQRPFDQKTNEDEIGFTQIYCCAKCGRLHNFVSLPCPNCDWFPQTIKETARSLVLSTSHLKVSDLLFLSREMAKNRTIENIIPNLTEDTQAYLTDVKLKQVVEQIFLLLRQDEHKNHRTIGMFRKCIVCDNIILESNVEECQNCKAKVNWPDTIRLLACMDNLLYLFEQYIEISTNEASSDFVCLLVNMTNNILRKQETPSNREIKYSLKLLSKMGAISDLNEGVIISTENPNALKIYFVQDKFLKDSEFYVTLLINELKFFISIMTDGIEH